MVASAAAGASTLRMSANRVVKPPSTRMTASAAVPTFLASSTSSNCSPSPSSPSTTPTSRKNSRLGNPTRVATRVPTMLASSTKPPISNARYSCVQAHFVPVQTEFGRGSGAAHRARRGRRLGVMPVNQYQPGSRARRVDAGGGALERRRWVKMNRWRSAGCGSGLPARAMSAVPSRGSCSTTATRSC